jgi:anti-sigma factor RsiW
MKARKNRREKSRQVEVSCQKATAVLTDYVNGRLDPSLEEAFDRHVSICPDCVAFLNTYKKAVQLAKSFLSQELASPNLERIKGSLEGKVRRASGR